VDAVMYANDTGEPTVFGDREEDTGVSTAPDLR
jgi:hypothetical protein